jgi:hypothetical protein
MLFSVFSCLLQESDHNGRPLTRQEVANSEVFREQNSCMNKWSICKVKLKHHDLKADITHSVESCLHAL